MEANILAQWTAISILNDDASNLFLGNRNFHDLCENTLALIREKKSISDSLFVLLFSSVPIMIALNDMELHDRAVNFLINVILSANLAETERDLIIQLAKKHIPSMAVFWCGRCELIDRMTRTLDCKESKLKHSTRILQSLEFMISGTLSESEVLLLVYTPFDLLLEADSLYFAKRVLSLDEIHLLITRNKMLEESERALTISVFISSQVRSPHPSCRGYAYRILGLIAMRCFSLLGERIIEQLLIKKRFQEVSENRIIITVILWNLLYIWPETLAEMLIPLESNFDMEVTGLPENLSLLKDLWVNKFSVEGRSIERFGMRSGNRPDTGDGVGTEKNGGGSEIRGKGAPSGGFHMESYQFNVLRSVCILSAARIIVARRMPTIYHNHHMIFEIVRSFILRSTVENNMKNLIQNSHIVKRKKEEELEAEKEKFQKFKNKGKKIKAENTLPISLLAGKIEKKNLEQNSKENSKLALNAADLHLDDLDDFLGDK